QHASASASSSSAGGFGGSGGSTTATTTVSSSASSSSGMMAVGDPCRGIPLPADQHFVPAGLCARLVGRAGGIRQITFVSNGDLLGVSTGGSVKLFHDADADGTFSPGEGDLVAAD